MAGETQYSFLLAAIGMKDSNKSDQNKILKTIEKKLPTFNRVGQRFLEDHGDFVKMVQVPFTRIGDNEKTFTIYFSTFVPSLFKMLWDVEIESKRMEFGNGVFNCNINDLLIDPSEKRKIKYWDIPCDNSLVDEIEQSLPTDFYRFQIRLHHCLTSIHSSTTRHYLLRILLTPRYLFSD